MTKMQLGRDDEQRISKFVQEFREYYELPGVAVSMAVCGRRFSAAVGKAGASAGAALTGASNFEPGCFTKFWTAVVALVLSEDGILDLDLPIAKILPELAGPIGDTVSVRKLLSHTAGYQEVNLVDRHVITQWTWADMVKTFASREVLFQPGSVYSYSHSGSVLIGQVIRAVTGQEVPSLARDLIWDPLGIFRREVKTVLNTRQVQGHLFAPQERRYCPIPAVGWSTQWRDSLSGPPMVLSDLVEVGQAMLDRAAPFSPFVLESLLSSSVRLPQLFGSERREEMPVAFGEGAATYAGATYGVASLTPGQTCSLRINSELGIALVVALNASQPHLRDLLSQKLMAAFDSRPLLKSRNDLMSPTQFEFSELRGLYQGAVGCAVRVEDDVAGLRLQPLPNPAVPSLANSDPIVFRRAAAGHLVPKAETDHLSLGFFREPINRRPALMIGHCAFAKID